ncbi:MAG: transcription-repair coupling factor [Verrucomicrobiia bacterium]
MNNILERLKLLNLGGDSARISGIRSVGYPFLCAALNKIYEHYNLLIVLEDQKEQELFYSDLAVLLKLFKTSKNKLAQNTNDPLFFAEWDVFPDDGRLPNADVLSDRLETLKNLSGNFNQTAAEGDLSNSVNNKGRIVVSSVVSLVQKTLPPEVFKALTLKIKTGGRFGLYEFTNFLIKCGYTREVKVSQKGEFAQRGGIVDVYPLTGVLPIRLEFFGDQVDSIRVFDPISQLSKESIDSAIILPAGEYAILKNALLNANEKDDVLRSNYINDGAIYGATLLDYLNNAILILCNPEKLALKAESYLQNLVVDKPLFVGWKNILNKAKEKGFSVLEIAEEDFGEEEVLIEYTIQKEKNEFQEERNSPIENRLREVKLDGNFIDSLDSFRPITEFGVEYQIADVQRKLFFEQVQKWLNNGFFAVLVCPGESQLKRFKELWEEYRLDPKWLKSDETNQERGKLLFFEGSLTRGFIVYGEPGFVVITDAEIFGRLRYLRPRRLKSRYYVAQSVQSLDFAELEEGDYVVHINYGIGRFLGLEKIQPSGRLKGQDNDGQECLVIEYAPSRKGEAPPKLYVPVSESHLVTKYIGSGRGRPPLNKLTGKQWQKAKEKAENAIKDLASELLALQAERMSSPGFAFAPDSTWQCDFENSFEFEETPDQLQAILDTKADMELPKPMDRLICGDVGYGKTEVALRAAFKAVMSGKQVAVLVPTTVLAQQHYNTFRSRMAPFPINIGLLSRYLTRGKQAELIRQIAEGRVDIVIGTHRLLQDDVVFYDLGLLIIDEEQRFGVLHKEKLKLIKRKVDVLTLTATPIPRTLYLALMGARDMSVIETPPHDRLPVETIVAKYDENLIRAAIIKELKRGGQVFYLHNQVYDIDQVAEKLNSLVPEARIVVGHGQMTPRELENAMTKFVNGEADVLLSTTIVENGLDIPNANTIIVDRADRFGLSDLYQLRGRVGRYKHQAYAYLLLPRHTELLSDARKRISAIKQYSSLGSGFKVAMRDLEIRGAGNILGVEQSGHIAAIGFHLYCQLLEKEIKALKGEKVKPLLPVTVHFDFIATSPAEETDSIPLKRLKSKTDYSGGIFVPREVAYYVNEERRSDAVIEKPIIRAPAYIPMDYIEDPNLRTEVYRKIARATSPEELANVETEIKDRFGPLPDQVKLVLLIAEIKILAADKGVTKIETKGDKLILIRNNDYIMLNGKFPRLTKRKPEAKLKEIKYLLKQL